MTPADFSRIVEILRTHAPPALAEQIVAAWNRYLGTGADFAVALGITRRARKQYMLSLRNEKIQLALRFCPGQNIVKKVQHLHLAIENFRNVWPAMRALPEPPSNLDDLGRVLFEAFQISAFDGMPATERAIAGICEMEIKIHFEIKSENAVMDVPACGADTVCTQTPKGSDNESCGIQETVSRHHRCPASRRPPTGRPGRERPDRSGKPGRRSRGG